MADDTFTDTEDTLQETDSVLTDTTDEWVDVRRTAGDGPRRPDDSRRPGTRVHLAGR